MVQSDFTLRHSLGLLTAVMDPQAAFLAEWNSFVCELVTPERRNILALTEIARDALQNYYGAAGSVAAVITNRILQARHSWQLYFRSKCAACNSERLVTRRPPLKACSPSPSHACRRCLSRSCRHSTCWTA